MKITRTILSTAVHPQKPPVQADQQQPSPTSSEQKTQEVPATGPVTPLPSLRRHVVAPGKFELTRPLPTFSPESNFSSLARWFLDFLKGQLERHPAATLFLGGFALWTAFVAVVQYGISDEFLKTAFLILYLIFFGGFLSLLRTLSDVPGGLRGALSLILYLSFLVVPIAAWISVVGSYSLWMDAGALVLALGVAVTVARRQRILSRRSAFLIGFYLSGWIFLSIADGLLLTVLSFRDEVQPQTAAVLSPDAPHIGVALSGGGYRAALLHAGVLDALQKSGIRPTHLSTVSGGSIIGAFYASGRDPVDFLKAVQNGRFNLKRQLTTLPNALRLLFPFQVPLTGFQFFPWYSFDRNDVQRQQVERFLLGNTEMKDLVRSDYPRLMICATDLISGRAVGLREDGLVLRGLPQLEREGLEGRLPYRQRPPIFLRTDADTFPANASVASLVVTSGAFPLAFRAVPFEASQSGQEQPVEMLLSDGGIVDNSGLGLLLDSHYLAKKAVSQEASGPQQDWKLDLILISDGSQFFTFEKPSRPSEFFRAMEVVHAGSGMSFMSAFQPPGQSAPPIVRLSPSSLIQIREGYEAKKDSPDPEVFEADTATKTAYAFDIDLSRLDEADLADLEKGMLDIGRRSLDESNRLGERLDKFKTEDAAGSELSAFDRSLILKLALEEELKYCLGVFLTTSTLEDQPGEMNAAALFRLGEILLIMNRRELLDNLPGASAPR